MSILLFERGGGGDFGGKSDVSKKMSSCVCL